MNTCSTCAFWNPPPDGEGPPASGECRADPPAMVGTAPTHPTTPPTHWCGRHQARSKRQLKTVPATPLNT